MKWIPLKMNFLPLLFKEINNITEEYITLLNKIRQKDIEKQKSQKTLENINPSNEESPSRKTNKFQTQSEGDNENYEQTENEKTNEDNEELEMTIKKFNSLRESISKRINELEEFYEDNIEDIRVSNFEKARLRLKKLLMYTYDNINRVENSAQQKNIFIRDNINLFSKKITQETKRQILENNTSIEKKAINQKKKKEEKKTKKKTTIDSYESKKGINNKKDGSNVKSRVFKVTGNEGFLRQTENRKKSSVITESEIDYEDYSKCREIIFKIKLSQDEYKLLLKEKKNNKGTLSPYLFK
jgi:hypothetical protein